MTNYTDEQLMSAVQNGNKEAFGVLVKKYLPEASLYVKYLLKQENDDITQDSFVKAWQNAYQFKPDKAKFKTWLYTIIKNNCYNYLKQNKITIDINDIKELIADDKQNAEQALISKQSTQHLHNLINKLNKREQQAITLKYLQQLSQKEIAEIMQSSVKAIEGILSRAKQKLKQDIISRKEDL